MQAVLCKSVRCFGCGCEEKLCTNTTALLPVRWNIRSLKVPKCNVILFSFTHVFSKGSLCASGKGIWVTFQFKFTHCALLGALIRKTLKSLHGYLCAFYECFIARKVVCKSVAMRKRIPNTMLYVLRKLLTLKIAIKVIKKTNWRNILIHENVKPYTNAANLSPYSACICSAVSQPLWREFSSHICQFTHTYQGKGVFFGSVHFCERQPKSELNIWVDLTRASVRYLRLPSPVSPIIKKSMWSLLYVCASAAAAAAANKSTLRCCYWLHIRMYARI